MNVTRSIFAHVAPLHTCGSPALVDLDTAEKVAAEEVGAFARVTTWGRDFNPEATRVADEMGLAGIVYSASADGRKASRWQVWDRITGWVGVVDLLPGERLQRAVQRVQGNIQEPGEVWLLPVYRKQADR